MKNIHEFYGQYDEETRLVRHFTEFIVTTYFLDDLIHNNDKILDVAAGTGAYAIYYAEKGCTVEAIDIVPKHIELLSTKIKREMELFASVGNALDLHEYEDDFFDVVLNMGPVYHIEPDEVMPCLKESLRVTKPGGKLAIAYVNKFDHYQDYDFTEYFTSYSPEEMITYVDSLKARIILHVPTDGAVFDDLENYYQSTSASLHQSHMWLEDNYSDLDMAAIEHRFIHALLVIQKNQPSH